jgi:DNA (cytosine-5)-methyltransferase 1
MKPRFYDFFAGAGLATLGLRNAWECIWANDIAPLKAAVYTANFGADHFLREDLTEVAAAQPSKTAEIVNHSR